MAIGASGVWECRTNGSEFNGGGFLWAAAGTDYSQRDTKRTAGDVTNISVTDGSLTGATSFTSATINATSALVGNIVCTTGGTRTLNVDVADVVGNGTATITSATANWDTLGVGAVLKISGGNISLNPTWYKINSRTNATTVVLDKTLPTGTGFTVVHSWFFAVTGVTNATTVTVDRNTGNATGATINVGGALSTPMPAILSAGSSNKIWLKVDGTYTTNVGFVTANGYGSPTNTIPVYLIQGYTTTRGDSGRATIQLTGSTSGLFCFKASTAGWQVQNLICDCNNLAVSTGISLASGEVNNCKFMNFSNAGVYQTGNSCMIYGNEFTGATSSAASIWTTGNGNVLDDNYVHDCAMSGSAQGIYAAGSGNTITRNIVVNLSGATTDGIQVFLTAAGQDSIVRDNLVYGCGQNGISVLGTSYVYSEILGNISCNNGAYGIKFGQSAGQRATPRWDGNVYFSNTSGNRFGGDDTGTVNKVNAIGAYTNQYEVVLSSSPFINAAAGDFRLNSNSAGAACRGSSTPRTWPGLTNTPRCFADMGPIQHQEQGTAG